MALNAPPSAMNPYSRPRQISPLSIESTDSSFYSRYQQNTPIDSPYSANSANSARTPNTMAANSMVTSLSQSPPRSQHHSTSTETSGSHSQGGSNNSPPGSQSGHFSSASSVAPSSNGLHSPIISDSGRPFTPRQEEILQEHYNVLRGFLAQELSREAVARTARAKDKLIRLSPTQYLELSTDVYDEFRRREDDRRRRGQGVPRHLPPRNEFHPKRNQARQKLSHLSPDRFKQLATDAFFELERRIPRLAGSDLDRRTSPAGSMLNAHPGPGHGPGRMGTPLGSRGPPSPLPPGGYRGPGPGPGPGHGGPGFPHQNMGQRSTSNDYGRPLPQSFQSNNLIPTKGTMIEDDGSSTDDRNGSLRLNTRFSPASARSSPSSAHPAVTAQIAEMQEKLNVLETQMQSKSAEIERMLAAKVTQESCVERERQEWEANKQDLEQQLAGEQRVRQGTEQEKSKMREQHIESQAELRDQMETNVAALQAQIAKLTTQNDVLRSQPPTQVTSPTDASAENEWRDKCEQLQSKLAEQERTTDQVRRDAAQFLQEMRALSEQSDVNAEREEQLHTRIQGLESEVRQWKDQYAKTKTLLRTMKASSIGLSLHPTGTGTGTGGATRPDFLSPDGAVRDVEMTNFQMSIDELLLTVRRNSSEATLDKMKGVIQLVQHMTIDTDKTDGPLHTGLPSPASSPKPAFVGDPKLTALRSKATRAASNLISTTRTFVSSKGLAPVSLVDAAAANLTAAVIEYVKLAGIRASPASELQNGLDSEYASRNASQPDVTQDIAKTPDVPALAGPTGWFNRLKGSFDSTYSNDNALDDDSDGFR